MHGDCLAHRWSLGNNRQLHCGFCCPPPPVSPTQIEDISRLTAGWKKPDQRELDTWQLQLTCDHVVKQQMHHTNQYWSRSVIDCPTCGTPRGVVTSERIRTGETEAREQEAARAKELRAAKQELAKLRRASKAVEAQIAALEG